MSVFPCFHFSTTQIIRKKKASYLSLISICWRWTITLTKLKNISLIFHPQIIWGRCLLIITKNAKKHQTSFQKTYSRTSFQKISKEKIFPKNPSKKISQQQKCPPQKNGPNAKPPSPLRVPWRWVKPEVPNQRRPSCLPRPSCPGPGEGEAAGIFLVNRKMSGVCHNSVDNWMYPDPNVPLWEIPI